MVKNKDIVSKKQENLTTDDIFRLLDLYFRDGFKNLSFLHNSYDKFIEDVKIFLTRGEHIIFEIFTEEKKYTHFLTFSNVVIEPPILENGVEPMSPSYSRLNNKNYSGKIRFNVTQKLRITDITTDKEEISEIGKTEKGISINIPIMLRSSYCNMTNQHEIAKKETEYDPGGYFIIKGMDRIIISQDSMAPRQILVFEMKDNSKYSQVAQINSKPSRSGDKTMQAAKVFINKHGIITVKIPVIEEVNAIVFFKALDIITDGNIVAYSTYDYNDIDAVQIIRKTMEQCKDNNGNYIKTKDEALNFLLSKIKITPRYIECEDKEKLQKLKKIHLLNVLKIHFLPHVEGDLIFKGYHLGLMVNRIINVYLGRRDADDRDSYLNKRVDTPGDLLFELFYNYFNKTIKETQKIFKNVEYIKNPINVINQIRFNNIDKGIILALSTGNWPRQRTGIAQIAPRLSYFQTISVLSRIDVPENGNDATKIEGPRHLHQSMNGFLCPVQTPENENIGLNKNKTIIADITIFDEDMYFMIKDTIENEIYPIYEINPVEISRKCKIFLNGELLGFVDNITEYSKKLNKRRDDFHFDRKNVSIITDYPNNEINVYCDGGRFIRPVLKVNKNNELNIKKNQIDKITLEKTKMDKEQINDWDEFIRNYPDTIDYIDMMIQDKCMIADKIDKVYNEKDKIKNATEKLKKDGVEKKLTNRYDEYFYVNYDYSEIHPSTLLAEMATNIAFSDHNEMTRNIHYFSQGKQSMGIYMPDYRRRVENSNISFHPTRPLASTRTSKYTNFDILPTGEMAIVAIASYTGYNQEDSIIMNKTAAEVGLFRACSYTKYTAQITKNQSTSQDDIFMKPDPSNVIGMQNGYYQKLNEKGFVPEEESVENGDILIGKVTPLQEVIGSNKNFRDSSKTYKSVVPGVVDRVYNGIINQDGYETIKMSIRSERFPLVGDKFCSRHGQKGTLGAILRSTDLPFTENGIVPDLIINPNAIPKRETIAQLIETLTSKYGALVGEEIDATPFESYNFREIEERLKKYEENNEFDKKQKELEKITGEIMTNMGLYSNGFENMYNGMTGEKLKYKIFIGPTYYHRLKHQVYDKVHGRSRGPRTMLTRQPTEGRSRDGGLRTGEMEKDSLLAHGIACMLKERMLDCSDAYATYVCGVCGLLAQRVRRRGIRPYPSDDDIYYCPSCKNFDEIHKIVIPYAFKLIYQELEGMHIAPRIKVKE
jgi:DNA-directed RNA polymerase II subunit RPB2